MSVFGWRNVAQFSDKGIHRIQGDFEVLRADIEVEKAVVAGVEIDQVAAVAFAFHHSDKLHNHIVGRDGVDFAVNHQGGGKLAANVVVGVEFRTDLGVGEPLVVDISPVGMDKGTDSDHRLRPRVVAIDDLQFFSHGE